MPFYKLSILLLISLLDPQIVNAAQFKRNLSFLGRFHSCKKYLKTADDSEIKIHGHARELKDFASGLYASSNDMKKELLATFGANCQSSAETWMREIKAARTNNPALARLIQFDTRIHFFISDTTFDPEDEIILDGTYRQFFTVLKSGETRQDPNYLRDYKSRWAELDLDLYFIGTYNELADLFYSHPANFPRERYETLLSEIGIVPENTFRNAVQQYIWYIYDVGTIQGRRSWEGY